jgi:hypothetical protein
MIPPSPVWEGVYDATEGHAPEIIAGIQGVQDQPGFHLAGAVELHIHDTTQAGESYLISVLDFLIRQTDEDYGCDSV